MTLRLPIPTLMMPLKVLRKTLLPTPTTLMILLTLHLMTRLRSHQRSVRQRMRLNPPPRSQRPRNLPVRRMLALRLSSLATLAGTLTRNGFSVNSRYTVR